MAVTPNLNLYLTDDDDYVSVARDLSDNFEKIDAGLNGKAVTGWSSPAGVQSPQVHRSGKMILVCFRYDILTSQALFTNMPKAKYFQRTIIVSQRLRNAGVLQIEEGGTSIN